MCAFGRRRVADRPTVRQGWSQFFQHGHQAPSDRAGAQAGVQVRQAHRDGEAGDGSGQQEGQGLTFPCVQLVQSDGSGRPKAVAFEPGAYGRPEAGEARPGEKREGVGVRGTYVGSLGSCHTDISLRCRPFHV
uniref:Uncharacterized protein n=1 Tax=Streptomyces avermitilis TaxID=33903 RepID=A0A499W0M6_STRAX|nr:hypothetical protein SAVMC3_81900 [Streptomyces avermitilis]